LGRFDFQAHILNLVHYVGARSAGEPHGGWRKLKVNSRACEAIIFSVLFLALGFAFQNSPNDAAPSIGIAVGEKMPPFSATNQFGNEVSSDSLKGPNGTVLVFFRSADW
jgi:cytochrome oxidase Cu insertion factor (SCO1/SenC/PrrC family)